MVAVLVAAGALCASSPALAATSTISVANDTTAPEQAVPVDLTVSGTNGSANAAELLAVERPAGGLACQASYQEDVSTLGTEDTPILAPGTANAAVGPYSVNADFKPSAAGSYQVCAWLDGGSTGTDPLAPPATLTFAARGPVVSQLTVAVPAALVPNQSFQVTYTTQTDQQLNLYSAIAPAGAAPCAASWEAQSTSDKDVFADQSEQVFGGPVTTTAQVKEPRGSFVICTWIEGPAAEEVDAATATPITVGTPLLAPALKLGRVTASRRHGISVAGTTAAKLGGHLSVLAACGRSTRRGSATVRRGRFAAHVGLPAGCGRSSRQVRISVSFPGTTAYAKQSVSRTVAIRG